MKFIRPIDGDVLFSVADGTVCGDGLNTAITLRSEKGRNILINSVPATENDGVYSAEIYIDGYRNAIEAVDADTGESETIYIYWFRNGYRTYRLGVDDVIWCFENIYKHRDEYTSIFQDPFLAMYKELHDTYGTYIHMHIYYETEDGNFNLSMFPDKYKEEFEANGDWLKFTFHARCNMPSRPYKYASYAQVIREGRQVEKEILRFAGKAVMSNVTSQHFADSNLQATRGFRNLGFRCLDAYFIFDKNDEPDISYYLNKEQVKHASERDFWVDNKEDIIFVKDDIIINDVALDKITSFMEKISAAENHCFHYLLIHEQYFYEHFHKYEHDYKERVFKTVDWCHKHGYKPATISSIAFEERL